MIPPFILIAGAFTFAFSSAFSSENRGTLVFEDHFDRSEPQETTEEIGNGWTTNSKTRAGGNKQVDLKNGALHITLHPAADHAVGVAHASATFPRARTTATVKQDRSARHGPALGPWRKRLGWAIVEGRRQPGPRGCAAAGLRCCWLRLGPSAQYIPVAQRACRAARAARSFGCGFNAGSQPIGRSGFRWR
jgi:hypothetical protein